MKRKKAEVEEHESSLDKEEKILEGIRDSLKGELFIYFLTLVVQQLMMMHRTFEDKTQVFHDQIEVKQKELQPWTTKINTKQAEVDVASSERDALAKKAEGVKRACQEAQESLEKLQADREAKVRYSGLKNEGQ